MKRASALFVSVPVVFGALAHFLRERDTLVIMSLTGWLVFTGIALLWAFLIRRDRRGLAAFCAVSALAQFAAFALLFALVDSRAKTRGRMAVVSPSSSANHTMQRMRASRSAPALLEDPRRLARTADGDR